MSENVSDLIGKKDVVEYILCSAIWVDDENNIFLIVEDNGVGMQPEQVVQINKEMYEDIWVNRTTGFGIANVNRRIKLYYGEEYGLILESEPDIGTKVIVVVPKTRQAEKK